MIKQVPVKTFKTVLICDRCGAEMVRTSYIGAKEHIYRCPACKYKVIDTEMYPGILYIEECQQDEKASGDLPE